MPKTRASVSHHRTLAARSGHLAWLRSPMRPRVFGEIRGVPAGTHFADRRALAAAGVHRPLQAGISGSSTAGCDSIVVSGGYVDDEDFGDRLIYTGHGGNDGGRQVAHQALRRGNLALAVSCDTGRPVRVIRGKGGDPRHSPASGYRYSGIFHVTKYWPDNGKHGFRIWRFELRSETVGDAATPPPAVALGGEPQPPRALTSTLRIVRNTAVGRQVKEMHGYVCQFCGMQIETLAGFYAEAAHVRPLGSPHHGPDVIENVLCLCPNCHVRFDRLVVSVDDEGRIKQYKGSWSKQNQTLRTVKGHAVSKVYLREHRLRCELACIDIEAET